MSAWFFLWAPVALAQSLTVTGSCPGATTVQISGVLPGGTVGILSGSGAGSDVMPGGPCAGGRTGLAGRSFLTTLADADGNGQVRLSPGLPDGACGQSIQVVDTGTCLLSEVAPLPAPPSVLEELGITMVLVPGGTYDQGCTAGQDGECDLSECPASEITLSRSFWLSETEVTQAQFEGLMGYNPSHFFGWDDQPVASLTWHEAAAYANALSVREGFADCYV